MAITYPGLTKYPHDLLPQVRVPECVALGVDAGYFFQRRHQNFQFSFLLFVKQTPGEIEAATFCQRAQRGHHVNRDCRDVGCACALPRIRR